MDMHTHITSQSSPDSYLRRFTANEADVAALMDVRFVMREGGVYKTP